MQRYDIKMDRFVDENLPDKSDQPEFIFTEDFFKYPERLNACTSLLDRWMGTETETQIVFYEINAYGVKSEITYGELGRKVAKISNYLIHDMGVYPGNRVLIQGANSITLVATWLAVLKVGAVGVLAMQLLRSYDLAKIIRKANIGFAIVADNLKEEILQCADPSSERFCKSLLDITFYASGALPISNLHLDAQIIEKNDHFVAYETCSHDPAIIAFTSGTTGEPKAAVHFHRDLLVMNNGFCDQILELKRADVTFGTPPIAFTYGLGALVTFPMHVGAASLLMASPSIPNVKKMLQDESIPVSVLFTSPTYYKQFSKEIDMTFCRQLRKCVSAGEALSEYVRTLWKNETGLDLIDGIGGTELMHIYASSKVEDMRPGAIGRALKGYEVMVLNEKYQLADVGCLGFLAVKGPTGCRYLNDARQKDVVINGWTLTGDYAVKDEDGYIFYKGRSDDLIVSSGYNICGLEIEEALSHHSSVEEVAVVGKSDAERGQIVKAFIVPKRGIDEPLDKLKRVLMDYVKSQIAPYKYPREIEFVDSLPKSNTGKILRKHLVRSVEEAS